MTPALQEADLAGQGRFVYNGWLQIPFWVQKLLRNISTELLPVEQLRDASSVAHSETTYHLLGKCMLGSREDGVREGGWGRGRSANEARVKVRDKLQVSVLSSQLPGSQRLNSG